MRCFVRFVLGGITAVEPRSSKPTFGRFDLNIRPGGTCLEISKPEHTACRRQDAERPVCGQKTRSSVDPAPGVCFANPCAKPATERARQPESPQWLCQDADQSTEYVDQKASFWGSRPGQGLMFVSCAVCPEAEWGRVVRYPVEFLLTPPAISWALDVHQSAIWHRSGNQVTRGNCPAYRCRVGGGVRFKV